MVFLLFLPPTSLSWERERETGLDWTLLRSLPISAGGTALGPPWGILTSAVPMISPTISGFHTYTASRYDLSEHAHRKWTEITSWHVTRCATIFLRLATLGTRGLHDFPLGLRPEILKCDQSASGQHPHRWRYPISGGVQRSSIATKKVVFSLGIEGLSLRWLGFDGNIRLRTLRRVNTERRDHCATSPTHYTVQYALDRCVKVVVLGTQFCRSVDFIRPS